MQDLRVTIVQSDLEWENPQQNLINFNQKLNTLSQPTDLIVLPEMFTTAFSLESSQFAEESNGPSVNWMIDKAKQFNCCITGSLLIKENNALYNRLFWVSPNGVENTYNKKHLFRFAGENNVFTSGKIKEISHYKEWNFMPLICYDLRFPVWSMNSFKNNNYQYDCLIYVANWPEKRRNAWISLLTARAIENQAYVIGVNRIGTDGKGNNYSGDSMIVDPKGNIVLSTNPHTEAIETITLNLSEVTALRSHFPVGLDWDEFEIKS